MFGQEPPMNFLSTTAVRRPEGGQVPGKELPARAAAERGLDMILAESCSSPLRETHNRHFAGESFGHGCFSLIKRKHPPM